MYRNLRLASRSKRESAAIWWNFIEGRAEHRKMPQRLYHSGSGVYGHRDRAPQQFEVPREQLAARAQQSNFYRLLTAYREHGHKQAVVNPIALSKPRALPELRPEHFGLDLADNVRMEGLLRADKADGTVEDALDILNRIYCGTMSAEFSYLESEEEREWFAKNFEECYYEALDDETRRAIAREMLKSQAFDRFLAVKFVSVKRYGGEGAESMMAFFHELFKLASNDTLKELVLCMPHRGRLNFLTGMLKFPAEKLFRKLRGLSEFPDDAKATGDVISHFVSSMELPLTGLHVSMLYNPSHLEAVNPVSMGRTRGLMQILKEGAYSDDPNAQWSDQVLNVQVHGDAAYTGQGINQECLALSGAPHFEIGGSIHMVVNNQVGFTTPAARGRSSRYCTDLAKFISSPVIHVNADDPESVVKATRIAFRYQRKFRKDVFVDLNCFRRWGHNELDDPTFTNPLTYKIIHNRRSIPDRYLDELINAKVLSQEQANMIVEQFTEKLAEALRRVDDYVPQATYFTGRWSQLKQADSAVTTWDTGVDTNLLQLIANKSVQSPEELVNKNVHPTLLKSHVESRLKKIESGSHIDWSTAEAMAFGSLLYQGYNVRISGQDIGRGTFSHRHAMLVDQSTGEMYIPLNSMVEGQTGKIELANSILSEEAVLGYEYGLSITLPNTLPIWEAQFGDFFNGAQTIIDTFVSSGEAKWMTTSGLTMLLPHGYDGAGPEHSSCKLERFLQLTDSREDRPDGDDVNMQVVNPTTPAQYFHLLRRQMVRNFRKPLILVAPKTLLRHVSATSGLDEIAPGTSFKTVIGDEKAQENAVRKVILVSGKHYYALEKHREILGAQDVAIIRVESLCPFPVAELNEEIQKYQHAKTFIWSQEEPQNMGAWSFVRPRFENLCGRQLRYSGREPLATSAVGIGQLHQRQSEEVVVKPFAMK
ncbi:probable 2-oxoglutarate dehydrogenase E1 component DHKTD1 homolog, mitochondrial isoform X1 [Nasonia vitripennis]|uniref:Transketolase-like pyrimidine-binding domain-containing protein n=1 Tax=Nasonia vitripennis TaxID=7425 RepID=A0A7M7HBB3_NASVI|nr:probable 2-oxoglutarate dehydrogenase E1 component DHKTD1 homolog, mitochondrial isoform X1 [Nasonia vitripennis]